MLGVARQLGLAILQLRLLSESLLLHFMEHTIIVIESKNFTTQLW